MRTFRRFGIAFAAWASACAAGNAQLDFPPGPIPQGPVVTGAPPAPPPIAPQEGPPVLAESEVFAIRSGWQVQIDPFLMWISGARFPPMLTTGDVNNTVPGALDQPGTRVLRGGTIDGGALSGLRLSVAKAFGEEGRGAFEVSGFWTDTRWVEFNRSSDTDGNPVLVRPFVNARTGQEWADYRSYPTYMSGTTHEDFGTQLGGIEANVYWDLAPRVPAENSFGFGIVAGARYFQLDEHYCTYDTSDDLPAAGSGLSFRYHDVFNTENAFVGGQVGAVAKWRMSRFAFDVTGKFLAGNNHQSVDINGWTRLSDAFGNVVFVDNSGLFVQPSNVGSRSRDAFAVGGELGLKLGWRVTDWFRINVGYQFFLLSNVIRPGDQIDRVVQMQSLIGTPQPSLGRPLVPFQQTTFYTQMLNFGFEFLF
jgi:hypothetical protein